MTSEPKTNRNYSLYAAIAIIVILAGSFAYYYTSASGEISSLKESGQTICSFDRTLVNPFETLVTNETGTLRKQIQSNAAIIASLNSTRPSGYVSVISTLTQETNQDKYMLTLVNNLNLASTSFPFPVPVSRSMALDGATAFL